MRPLLFLLAICLWAAPCSMRAQPSNGFIGTEANTADTHDYLVRSCDIVASDPSADVGQPILLMATITNIGDLDALDPTSVRFALDGQPIAADVLLPPITSGGSGVVTIPWTVTHTPQLLTVHVDPDTLLLETNRSNNQAAAILPFDFDVKINFQYRDPSKHCPGDLLEVSATVSNDGLLAADSVLVEFTGVHPAGPVGTSLIARLPAKTYCTVPVPTKTHLVELQEGDTIVYAVVDPDDQWPEIDEDDNVSTGNQPDVCSDDPGGGVVDLSVIQLEFSLETVQPGTELGFTQVYAWTGGANVPQAMCRLTLDEETICDNIEMTMIFPGFLYGSCVSTSVIPQPAGVDHYVTACIDPDDLIPESMESNNCADFLVDVGSYPTPASLTDFEATSAVEGIALRWQALNDFPRLAVERRVGRTDSWRRMETLTTGSFEPGVYATYQYLDRLVSPEVRYDYRIVGIDAQGSEQVLGNLEVWYSPPLPDRLVLQPPFPNPFNPSTRIRFSVPRPTHAEVRILDSSGRLVRRLWNATVEQGTHDLTWRGDDERGQLVPSGIYFCSVRTARDQQSHKLVLLK